jgi:hypothetical protein
MPDEPLNELQDALGEHYVSPARRRWRVTAAVGLLLVVVSAAVGTVVGDSLALPLGIPGLALLVAGLALASTATRASPAQVEAERAWPSSLPFRLEGYFEVLAHHSEAQCGLDVELQWQSAAAAPGDDLLLAAWAAHDRGARIHGRSGDTVTVRSSSIASPGQQMRTLTVYRNTKLPAFVHGLVDRVLVPLHRRHALARVSLRRSP